ncbi:hypothetical protein B7486_15805 [cyanobacterium TDX16]|nr:hypothetical protein B7486_15805 [cyanobacterium TDX16]
MAGDAAISTDFYLGADGETLRIATDDPDGLATIEDCFRSLASGRESEIAMHAVAGVEKSGFTSLHLRVGPDDLSPFRLDRIGRVKRGENSLLWIEAKDVWQDCVDMTKALRKGDGPGHQYLAGGGDYGIQILLSYREGKPMGER